jgi:hypothetical protein
MSRPIDLASPRIEGDGFSFYVGKKLYRNCVISGGSPDGNTVDFISDNGRFFVEWHNPPRHIQHEVMDMYSELHQKAIDKDSRQRELEAKNRGIAELKVQKAAGD